MRNWWRNALQRSGEKISVPAENKIKQKQYIENGRLPVIDQGSKLIGGYSDDEEKIVKCNLPVIVFGDHTKCVKYVNFPFAQVQME